MTTACLIRLGAPVFRHLLVGSGDLGAHGRGLTENLIIRRDRGEAVFLFLLHVRQALSGHPLVRCTCPLSGAEQTCPFAPHMSAFDPKRTLAQAEAA